jgi:predicted transcriptional regulator
MTNDSEVINSTDSLIEVAKMMKSLNIGVLPVEQATTIKKEKKVRRLIVLDSDNTTVTIISGAR